MKNDFARLHVYKMKQINVLSIRGYCDHLSVLIVLAKCYHLQWISANMLVFKVNFDLTSYPVIITITPLVNVMMPASQPASQPLLHRNSWKPAGRSKNFFWRLVYRQQKRFLPSRMHSRKDYVCYIVLNCSEYQK